MRPDYRLPGLLLGLLFLVRDRWMLVKTITSFTVTHSLTLAIATLGWAHAPTASLNVLIALSILFLGPEIARLHRGETSLAVRHPWVVAFLFGLLHGFGFAAVLRDIGLPQTELPTALLFFNVGVEIGQILFVLTLLAAFFVLRPLLVRILRWGPDDAVHWSSLTIPASYVIGSIASYWMIDRVSGFWS